jgi:hypothetical protein
MKQGGSTIQGSDGDITNRSTKAGGGQDGKDVFLHQQALVLNMEESFGGQPASFTGFTDFSSNGGGSPKGSDKTQGGEVVVFRKIMIEGNGVFWLEDDLHPEIILKTNVFIDGVCSKWGLEIGSRG